MREILQIFKNINVFYKFYPNFNSCTYYSKVYLFLMYALKLKKLDAFKEITINQKYSYLSEIIKTLSEKTKTLYNANDIYDPFIEYTIRTIDVLDEFRTDLEKQKNTGYGSERLCLKLVNRGTVQHLGVSNYHIVIEKWLSALNN